MKRRLALGAAGLALVVAVAMVALSGTGSDNDLPTSLEAVSVGGQDIKKLESKVSKLMQEVRTAGKDAEDDANERDKLAMELASDNDYAHRAAVTHKPALNPLRAEEVENELKEEIASKDHDVTRAETKRKALQHTLDIALDHLATEQEIAFDKRMAALAVKEKEENAVRIAKEQQLAIQHQAKQAAGGSKAKATSGMQPAQARAEIAQLQRKVQDLSMTLASLREVKDSGAESGKEYLAELGQELMAMPAVQRILTQSLGAKDLATAQQIADSLGQNFTASPAVDTKIVAEVPLQPPSPRP